MEENMNGNTKAVLKIDKVSVRTKEQKSWFRRKVIKKSTVLLNNVSAQFCGGDFIAVIGPSGAGKTTFLTSLAGKCTNPTEGIVTYNNKDVKDIEQGVIEIIPQFEVFVESLSVYEHLNFMMEIKLTPSMKASKIGTMNILLKTLKLKKHYKTTIKHLSGGERRLLSLASSLISNPRVIICDEPTTGLDSYNAALVVDVLKNLSNSNNIIICSIHQPSSDIFKEFKSIILLAEGRLLLYGNQLLCKNIFESVQLFCPNNYNPAEFYIRAISNPNNTENYISKIIEAYSAHSKIFLEAQDMNAEDSQTENIPFKIRRRAWLVQTWLLIRRSSCTIKRNKLRHAFELLTGVAISAFLIGVVYGGVSGTTQQGVQDFRGLLWLLASEVAFAVGYTSLTTFEFDLILFKREAGMYSSSAYYTSRVLCVVPKCIFWPISHVILATMFVNVPNVLTTGINWAAALILIGLASASYGLSLGALFTSSHITTEVMPFCDTILVLMSGAFMRISTIPVWLHGFKYISHFYYGMDAISNIYWRQIQNIDCSWNATVCVRDGTAVLAESGYSTDNSFWYKDFLGLILVVFWWSCLGFFGLWWEEKKGFAY